MDATQEVTYEELCRQNELADALLAENWQLRKLIGALNEVVRLQKRIIARYEDAS